MDCRENEIKFTVKIVAILVTMCEFFDRCLNMCQFMTPFCHFLRIVESLEIGRGVVFASTTAVSVLDFWGDTTMQTTPTPVWANLKKTLLASSFLCLAAPAIAQDVTLSAIDGSIDITGELIGVDAVSYTH